MYGIAIVGGARTPFTEWSGTPKFGKLSRVSAIDLGAHAARAAIERSKVEQTSIDHVIMGNALQTSADATYGARLVALKAGLSDQVPAVTVNRICGSGIESVIQASRLIILDEARAVVAGGMENMSQAPHVLRGLRTGTQPVLEDYLLACLRDPSCGLTMMETAERVAKQLDISREQQDAFANRSHGLGAAAVQSGLFADEIESYDIVMKTGRRVTVDKDDHIRPETNLETLASLLPSLENGMVTAGNASGIVDGAAALVLTTDELVEEKDLDVWGLIQSWSSVGLDPTMMGLGPVQAIRNCLKEAELTLEDIDLFEINEAFAAQYLGVEKELGLDRDKVNVNGGAIALGHPLGATGTRLILTLMHQLRRSKKRWGIASCCIGGGQGIAMLIENPQA